MEHRRDVIAASRPDLGPRTSDLGRPGPPSSWGLYLVTDRHQTGGRDLVDVVEQALLGGVRAVQLREKDLPADQLYRLAERLRAQTRARDAALIVNDRVDVAMAVGADGVHLGRTSLPPEEARRLLGPRAIVGVSCHSVADVREAAQGGANFVVLGPIYATPSKARYGPPLSPAVLRAARQELTLPILAIGGIHAARISEAIQAGADGVALISAVMAARDPAAAAAELLGAWEGTRALRCPGTPDRLSS